MTDLTGYGAVVVGGSRGIGAAVAHLLAELGAGVVVNGRDADAVDACVDSITAAGGAALGYSGPAHEESTADALISLCDNEFGRIDALVNCAGTAEPPGSSILSVSPAEFRALMDVHLGTVFATCRAAAPHMVAAGGGSIVNTSSFAFLGDYGGTGYPAGKGAVNGLTMAIAAELREHGVRANVVCPGAATRLSSGPEYEGHIETLRRRGMIDDVTARAAATPAPPEYVAPLYAFLAGPTSENVSGQIFVAASGFVGRFNRPVPTPLAYRDHRDSPPWTVAEIGGMIN